MICSNPDCENYTSTATSYCSESCKEEDLVRTMSEWKNRAKYNTAKFENFLPAKTEDRS